MYARFTQPEGSFSLVELPTQVQWVYSQLSHVESTPNETINIRIYLCSI
jgi:hypothetical protein